MLERVEGLLGTYADRLEISTFHGFCNRFLGFHAVELGLPARFRLLDQTEAWVFFRTLLSELELTVHWNVADPTGCIEGFLRFISRAKDELVTPEAYAAYAATLEDPAQRRAAREVARVYRVYQRRMRAAGQLDFGDLVVETLRALRTRPRMLQALQAQYRAILVDEFQDTNVAQIELLKTLSATGEGLCVVGDDDQAIYRFRGASFASFLLMKEAFPQVRTLRLSQNYRSAGRILGAAERLIRHNEPDRYDPQKRLWTKNPAGPPVEVLVVRDADQEAWEALALIRRLYQSQPEKERSYGRIAVLYRAHAHRDRLVELLRSSEIPFVVRGGTALFEEASIKDLVAFLQLLQEPDRPVELLRLLAHPLWGIPTEELMALSRHARQRQVPLWEVLRSRRELPLGRETGKAVLDFVEQLLHLRQEAVRSPILRLVERIAEESFFRTIFRLPASLEGGRLPKLTSEAVDPWLCLTRFLRFVHRYSQAHPGAQDLSSFLWYLDSVLQAGAREQIVEEEEEQEEPGRLRLMTVHQAKGLEFDWVVLLSLVANRFPSRSRPEPIPFPVELMKERLPQGDYHLQEERRLCYVACTRARLGLYLFTQDRAHHRSSLFVREILEGAAPQEVRQQTLQPQAMAGEKAGESLLVQSPPLILRGSSDFESLTAERTAMALLARIRALEPADEAGFTRLARRLTQVAGSLRGRRRRLSEFPALRIPVQEKFSYTQLETYRYCPLKYLYAYIFRIPIKTTPEMAFGIDLHELLEQLYLQVMKGRTPSLTRLLALFEKLQLPGRYGEPAQEQSYRRLGKEILTAFYRAQGERFQVPLAIEKPFALKMGAIRIQGVVDRIDPLEGGGVEVIDYKSGAPKERAGVEDQLQIRLYALACRDVFELTPKRVSFYYLRNNQRLSFEQELEGLDETRERILELTDKIRSGDFHPTPSRIKCRRCDFKALCPASAA